MKAKLLTIILISSLTFNSYSQPIENLRKPDYLVFQTGFIVDSYNSMGIRTYFEYQKDLLTNWQYGVSFEHSRHFTSFATDIPDELVTNLTLMSFNYYYKLNLVKEKLFWTTGFGVGAVHANWGNSDKIGPTVNVSLTLNIKLSKRIYFESSPLIVLIPSYRFYYSPMNAENHKNFYALPFFPFGIKVKL